MDIEKLIEQLSARGLSNGSSLGYHSGLFDEAATALSTLKAENAEMQKQLNEFSEFLCHITGGLLSKTNYTAQEMITTAEDYQQIRCDECDLRAENIRWGQIASEQDKAVERLQEENEKLKNAADRWKKKWAGLDKAVKNGSVYRPMRDQVEKVWRGEWIDCSNGWMCSRCENDNTYAKPFCPSCGSANTDEAVQMVMRRLEEMHETT